MTRRPGNWMIGLGALGFIAATAWWYAFFEKILGDHLQLARDCFYWESPACSAGRAAAVFLDLPAYDPALLWASIAVAGIGLMWRGIANSRTSGLGQKSPD